MAGRKGQLGAAVATVRAFQVRGPSAVEAHCSKVTQYIPVVSNRGLRTQVSVPYSSRVGIGSVHTATGIPPVSVRCQLLTTYTCQ